MVFGVWCFLKLALTGVYLVFRVSGKLSVNVVYLMIRPMENQHGSCIHDV